ARSTQMIRTFRVLSFRNIKESGWRKEIFLESPNKDRRFTAAGTVSRRDRVPISVALLQRFLLIRRFGRVGVSFEPSQWRPQSVPLRRRPRRAFPNSAVLFHPTGRRPVPPGVWL